MSPPNKGSSLQPIKLTQVKMDMAYNIEVCRPRHISVVYISPQQRR